jgi:hypothetical protein
LAKEDRRGKLSPPGMIFRSRPDKRFGGSFRHIVFARRFVDILAQTAKSTLTKFM